jgi:hypothetical protein
MHFISLLLSTADPVRLNVSHIMFYRRITATVTLIKMSDGSDVFVEDSPGDIDRLIDLIPRAIDELEDQITALGDDFDRLIAELDGNANG